MADFAEVAEIISLCIGNKDNQFIEAYYENIKLQTEEILETSLVVSAILKFMHDRNEWKGNATELLEQLDQVVRQKTLKNKSWPKASNVLRRRMNEVKTNLREVGIVIEEGEADPKTRVKTIVIKKMTDMEKISFGSLVSFDKQNNSQPEAESSNDTVNDISDADKTSQNRSLLSAYPKYIEWNGVNRQAPDLIFIDLDLSHFKSMEALGRALRKTLKKIKEKLDSAEPTVIWSGNGYHIYLPIKAFILESESVFAEFEKPSMKFLRFAEQWLTNNKADPCHNNNLSFKNCM